MNWTVYTAISKSPFGVKVIATKWTERGPQEPAKVVAVNDGATMAEGRALAAEMQQNYDRTRRVLASA